MSNAAKFTHEGSITVRARVEAGQLVISVADTGIGISTEALDRVFEQFQQADTSTTREYGGTGLGLSISRSLARLLGGDLEADSQEGIGTTFTLKIPLVYSARELQQMDKTSRDAPAQPAQPCDDLVLVIDDQPVAIELIREILTDAGYRVFGAQDGMQGLKLAREIRPLAITLDIRMPNKDGWQVLHDLKTDPLTSSIPVIMVTIVDKKVMGYRLGADDYLVKPLSADDLLASLNRLTGKRTQCRVLVVDDDPNVIDMIRQLLGDFTLPGRVSSRRHTGFERYPGCSPRHCSAGSADAQPGRFCSDRQTAPAARHSPYTNHYPDRQVPVQPRNRRFKRKYLRHHSKAWPAGRGAFTADRGGDVESS